MNQHDYKFTKADDKRLRQIIAGIGCVVIGVLLLIGMVFGGGPSFAFSGGFMLVIGWMSMIDKDFPLW